VKKALLVVMLAALVLGGWIAWADWPNPELEPLPWEPQAIVVLGGGNEDRIAEAWRLAQQYPAAPVIVTGDGGRIAGLLRERGLPPERLRHEVSAKSTMENADRVRPLLEKEGVTRAVLVTNWFHGPRASLSFRRAMPGTEFAVSFRPRREPLTPWDRACQRRERLAWPVYLLYGAVPLMYWRQQDG
jgi:uncharacterized SAM-binding protein YcdF (DUF218 family)